MALDARRHTGQRVAYVRVSSASKHLARQPQAVEDCDQVFTEKQSGRHIGERPQLAALIRHVRAGNLVVVAPMDRLARSVIDLNAIVQQITGDPAEMPRRSPGRLRRSSS